MADVQTSPGVLVVDDDDAIHRVLERLLRHHAYIPLHATTLSEAIDIAEQRQVDAIILDLGLRGQQSGLDVLRWFRARWQTGNLPVVVLTGQTVLSEEDASALAHHGVDVFYKPQTLHSLIDRLNELLRPPQT